jgi:hypothetical protein
MTALRVTSVFAGFRFPPEVMSRLSGAVLGRRGGRPGHVAMARTVRIGAVRMPCS